MKLIMQLVGLQADKKSERLQGTFILCLMLLVIQKKVNFLRAFLLGARTAATPPPCKLSNTKN